LPRRFQIRAATVADAGPICAIVRRSIVELCRQDHDDDPAILDAWLANKTPEIVAGWIERNPDGYFIALDGPELLGVAAMRAPGEMLLNYVSPDARFARVSTALVGTLESEASKRGWPQLTLTSTATARPFYRRRGYIDSGPPIASFGGKPAFPMAKSLPIVAGNG
jgi:GNAT superfamily N-acetyltransferase